jgi:hypothetical protein
LPVTSKPPKHRHRKSATPEGPDPRKRDGEKPTSTDELIPADGRTSSTAKAIPAEGGVVIEDRWLGEEWVDWSGETDSENKKVSKSTFFVCAGAGFTLLLLGAWLLLYLVDPRLSQLPGGFYLAARVAFWTVFILAAGWFVSVVISALIEKRVGLTPLKYNKGINLLYHLAFFVGGRLGVSRDRLGGSFIQVSNSLIRARGRRGQCKRLLILAPRCLSRGLKDGVKDMAERYGCEIFTAGGGEVARQKIAESKPSAVVGIACERDLVSGIRDVYPLLPVLAVPNVRPLGPCKETQVDLDQVEEAVKFFVSPK